MNDKKNSRLLPMLVLSLMSLAGAALAASITPQKLEAKTACEYELCGTSDHKCFDTDINYSCTGGPTTGICNSVKC